MNGENLRKLLDVMGIVRTHPEFSSCLAKRHINYLREEAYRHSELIETAGFNESNGVEYKKLNEAHEYLRARGITMSSLAPLGHIVQPETEYGNSTPSGFRIGRENVSFGKEFYGIEGPRVHSEMDSLVNFLNDSISHHPVTRAAEAHIEMVRVHPYVDGNGRVARILQNFCLEQSGLPPAIIPVTEKQKYFSLLGDTLRSRAQNIGNRESPCKAAISFRDYVEQKVLDSAISLRDHLMERRIYNVNFDGKFGKGSVFTFVHTLKSRSRNGVEKSIEVSVKKASDKKANLLITGNFSRTELGEFIKSNGECLKGATYTIIPLTDC